MTARRDHLAGKSDLAMSVLIFLVDVVESRMDTWIRANKRNLEPMQVHS